MKIERLIGIITILLQNKKILQAVILFDKSEKYRLVEEYGVNSFTETPEGNLRFSFSFTNQNYLLSWVLSFGKNAELMEPKELRPILQERLKNFRKVFLMVTYRYHVQYAMLSSCPVKVCCENNGKVHCGLCEAFPCDLLHQFSYDEAQGDNGKRIEQCRKW